MWRFQSRVSGSTGSGRVVIRLLDCLPHTHACLRDEARPRAFVFENVYALTYKNNQSRPWFDRLLKEVADAGYQFEWSVLNAADYGVPQLRPRVFVVGTRKGEKGPSLPLPSHGGRWERRKTGNPERPHVTTREAFKGLRTDPEPSEQVAGQWGHLLPDIPPGARTTCTTPKSAVHPDPIFKWRSRYWNFLLKLDPKRPSPVIQARPGPYVGPFHWNNRRLRVPEIRRLFSSDDFGFVGSRTSVQAQLGNSVPPLLARCVVGQLAEKLGS